MSDSVTVKRNKTVTTTSLAVSRSLRRVHRDIVRIIEKISPSGFKERNFTPLKMEYRGQQFNGYEITRDGLLFLAMGFTGKRAAKWKQQFIVAFREMEAALIAKQTNASDIEWNSTRLIGKTARIEEADAIKEFIEYATAQGSENAQSYYEPLTNATYRALGLMAQKNPKLRDQMGIYEISELMLAERLATTRLREYMDLGRNYKDIYESIKTDLLNFAEAVRLTH